MVWDKINLFPMKETPQENEQFIQILRTKGKASKASLLPCSKPDASVYIVHSSADKQALPHLLKQVSSFSTNIY